MKSNSFNLIKEAISLINRKRYALRDGIISDTLNNSTDVPQFSILEPLIFLIYVNDFRTASAIFRTSMFPDHITLISKIKLNHLGN